MMNGLYEDLIQKKAQLALIGLGYVGMPIAIAFAKRGIDVIGFDLNAEKIKIYQSGQDPTREAGDEEIRNTTVTFTSDENMLQNVKFFIVAVPTPVKKDHTPDLRPVENACRILGRHLSKGSVVVVESTVYPGVMEEICAPVLEKESGLNCGRDFKIGYSPERINPGDQNHRLNNIIKLVSGMDEETLDIVAKVYELVVDAGVYRVSSIKTAEAAKVIENSQRDINIAFMNELSMIFNRMGIDTKEVLEAASTKWNFLRFYPGLVGGHCIGVDPYYLTYKAGRLGYHSQVILSGRRINDDMGKYVAQQLIKIMIRAGVQVQNARVGILGFTFKENCPDIRNTKVVDIVHELEEYGIQTMVTDPYADAQEAVKYYQAAIYSIEQIRDCDAIVIAVGHTEYETLSTEQMDHMFRKAQDEKQGKKILSDLKGILDKDTYEKSGYLYWRL